MEVSVEMVLVLLLVNMFSVLGVRCLLDGLRVRYKVFIGLKEKRDQIDKYR